MPAWVTKDRVPLAAVAVHLRGSRETWAGAWCRAGRLWVPLIPRQWRLRLWMIRRPQTRSTVNAAPSPRHLRCRLLRRHWLSHRIAWGRGSSSTPSWLTGVPQAGSMDSLMSGSCTPRSQKFSTSPPQRYEPNPDKKWKVRIRSVNQQKWFHISYVVISHAGCKWDSFFSMMHWGSFHLSRQPDLFWSGSING